MGGAEPAGAQSAGPAGGAEPGTVVLHWQPASPVIAVRMSLLADDPAGLAGAGHLVQHLVLPRLEARLAQIGGEVQVERTADAVVFTAVGPAGELPFMANALRGALIPPVPDDSEWTLATRVLREERLAEWETPAAHVRSALRVRLFPADRSVTGTAASVRRLSPGTLGEAWAAMYDPRRISIVGAGDMRLEELRAAFTGLPERSSGEVSTRGDTVSTRPLAAAQATRGWVGAGYSAGDLDPAALAVVARLLEQQIGARFPAAAVSAELWWTHHGRALVVVAALPGAQMAAATSAISGSLEALAEEITPARVQAAATGVQRDLRFQTRAAGRMAALIGSFIERGEDAGAAEAFFSALADVSLGDVRAVLAELLDSAPVLAEVPPQRFGSR